MKLSRIGRACIVVGVLLSVAGLARVESLVQARGGDPSDAKASDGQESRSLGEFDAGLLVASAIVEHEFALVNDSGGDWRVKHAWADCGCLSVQGFEPAPIPPGAKLEVLVRLDTEGRADGPISERIHVLLESGEHLVGRVRAECVLAPHAEPPVMQASVPADDSFFLAECRLTLPAVGASIRAVIGDVHEGLQAELYEEPKAGPEGGPVYLMHVQGFLPEGVGSRLFIVPVHVLGLEGIPGAQESIWLKCFVERAVGLTFSPRLVLLDGSSPRAEGYVRLRDSAGGNPPALDFEVVPEGSIECRYDASSGRLQLSGARLEADGVVVRVRTPDGHLAEIPVVWK